MEIEIWKFIAGLFALGAMMELINWNGDHFDQRRHKHGRTLEQSGDRK